MTSRAKVYLDSLKGLVDQLKKDLDRDSINIICGRLSDFSMDKKKNPHWPMIREAQVKFAESMPNADWVNTDDLNDGPDSKSRDRKNALHYSVEGYKTLGRRYAEKSIALIKKDIK